MRTFDFESTRDLLALINCQILLIIGFSLFLCCAVPAQVTSANLSGMVIDEIGAVIPDVQITLLSVSTGLQRHAVTDKEGNFTISMLVPGNYTLTAELPGFATVTVNGITLQGAVNSSFQIILKPKALAESIDVLGTNNIDGHASQINLSNSSMKYSLTSCLYQRHC